MSSSVLSARALLVVAGACALVQCTSTLDPSIFVGGEAGAGGAPELRATCSRFVNGASEYTICPEPLDRFSAADDCAARDLSLVAVESVEENDFIADTARELVSGNLWLGGTRDDDYVWTWPDGSVFWNGGRDGTAPDGVFVQWQSGEPNDSSTVTTDPERCLALTPDGNDWNDRSCSLSLPYVCEGPGPTL